MTLERPFSILPIQVVPNETWLVDYDVRTVEIYCILYSEPSDSITKISFSQAYRLRWLEQAYQDSKGKWWLMNGKAIRQPLHAWAKKRNYYVFFKANEITFLHPTKLSF